jgi:hypothetical protein
MEIRVSEIDKPTVVDHILIPYTPITKELFLKESKSSSFEIYYKKKRVANQFVSKELRDSLSKNGFSFIKTERTVLKSRNKVFGIKITIQRNLDEDKIKELVIGIPSSNQTELIKKREVFLNELKTLVPDLEVRLSTSDKFVRC